MTPQLKFRAGGILLLAGWLLATSCLHNSEPKNRRGTVTLLGAEVEWDTLDGGGFDTISITTPDGYYDDYVQPVFSNSCATANCHVSPDPPAPGGGGWLLTGADTSKGLELTAGSSYDLLVDVESFKNPPMLRIKPGNPDSSFLYLKLFPQPPEGNQMPIGSFLDEEDIAKIKFWILDGAKRD